MYDYIIVGQGLAGSLFAYKCLQHNKHFLLIDSNKNNASKVSSGMYNPVVLKRFTPVWNALEQIKKVEEIFHDIEKIFHLNLIEKIKIHRIFHSVEEQKTWLKKATKDELIPFLNTEISPINNPFIKNNFATGEVFKGGKVDVILFLKTFRNYCIENQQLLEETFEYSDLNIKKTFVEYKTFRAKQIVFCEGYGLKENPFFNYLPLVGNKGETMIIKCPDLNLSKVVKSKVFIMPLENDYYFIGATYNWNDKDDVPTKEGKEELVSRLKTFLKTDFEIIKHQAGMRPTVIDRRPLVGKHETHGNLYVLNGLGTRGIMLGCSMAEELYNFIENNESLTNEIDIDRFKNKIT
ncbi:MAG: NAD(P)/FAD-dependent oxidoreductase [Flavobacteriales bacterium]